MLLSFRKSCVSRNPELMPRRIIKRISCTNDSPKLFPINSTEKLPLTPRCQLKRKPLSGQRRCRWLGNSCWGQQKYRREGRQRGKEEKRLNRNCLHSKCCHKKRKRCRETEAHLGRDSSERKMINLRRAELERGQVRRVICTNISLLRNG